MEDARVLDGRDARVREQRVEERPHAELHRLLHELAHDLRGVREHVKDRLVLGRELVAHLAQKAAQFGQLHHCCTVAVAS